VCDIVFSLDRYLRPKINPGFFTSGVAAIADLDYRLVKLAVLLTLAVGIPMFKPPVALAT
jgi:hypothetical protein